MMDKVRRLWMGCAIIALGMSHQMFAQDDADEAEQDADNVAAREKFENATLTDEDAVLIEEVAKLEEIRRKSFDSHGMASLEKARAFMKAKDYTGAIDQYKQALDFLIKRPANEDVRKEAETGLADAYYSEANQLLKRYDSDGAKAMAEEALQLGHPRAARLLDQIKVTGPIEPPNREKIEHRINDESYKIRQDEIRKRLRLSRQYLMTTEFERAMEECELILRDYPDQVEAIELRGIIARRWNTIAKQEELSTRDVMIKDVTAAWTPETYALNSAQSPKGKNVLGGVNPTPGSNRSGETQSQIVNKKLKNIILPEVSFRPPATIIDAVDFFKQASRDYDDQEIPFDQRGVNLILKLPASADAGAEPGDMFSPAPSAAAGVPVIPAMSARNISLFDALKLVCEVTGMKTRVTGNIVMIVPINDPDRELVRRSYNVLPSLPDRLNKASSDISSRSPANNAGGGLMMMADMSGTSEEADWKKFFSEMGVLWPTGSAISYTLGKLRVTNTEDQLAVFEQILEELNVTEKLVEIEARFVEVSQEDLNSLGFEWLLNGDFSFNAGGFARNLLGMEGGAWGNAIYGEELVGNFMNNIGGTKVGGNKTVGVNSINGMTIDNYGRTYSSGNRYLSSLNDGTVGLNNPITGQNVAINDNFMRLNAFIGGADVSMILHMLSQRSDTDVLSCPKVTVSPDQEAVMKVVTEYIYPSEFNVQISQQGNSGGSIYGGGSGEPLAIVEPQNFTMREVGVILQVIPKLSDDGQMITLAMRPQVVSEPVWKNYGTRVPRQVVVPGSLIGGILQPDQLVTEYIELPMEQPFFSVRSVETQLTINNGATVVMGGLITEARATVEDKVPLLGDIPFLGRLFRSRAEKTTKRNLLVFVTARTLDASGRILRGGSGESLFGAAPNNAVTSE